MKIKENLLLKKMGNEYIVVPVGQGVVDFKVVVTLNESGAFLWNKLKEGSNVETLAESLTKEYEVSLDEAKKDTEDFVKILVSNSLIDYEKEI